jgi:hypothetical protein
MHPLLNGKVSRAIPNPCKANEACQGVWRLRMNPLKLFEGPEAKITDGRYDKIIVPKRMRYSVNSF